MKKVYEKPSVVVDTFLTQDYTNTLNFHSFTVGFNSGSEFNQVASLNK